MRELLLAFIFALIVGSIINGMQQKPNSPPASAPTEVNSSATQKNSEEPRRDFPDFASFANIDNDNFESTVLKSEKAILVDCYVPNNQACEQMIPLVAAVAKAHEDSLSIARMNIMDNVALVHQFDISAVPTFLLFDKGSLVARSSGVLSQDKLESMMSSLPHEVH